MTDLTRSRSLISASLSTSQRNHLYRALEAPPVARRHRRGVGQRRSRQPTGGAPRRSVALSRR
jgi:hypothetical protein